MVVARLVCFAAISVMFADKPVVQAGLGLLVLFVSIWLHNRKRPYLEDDLDHVEEAGLLASWVTLYGGILLFSADLGNGFNMFVTVVILCVNFAFGIYILWILAVPAMAKLQEHSNEGVSAMTGRFRALTSSFKVDKTGEGHANANGVEMVPPARPHSDSQVALFARGHMATPLSSGRQMRLDQNPLAATQRARRMLGLLAKGEEGGEGVAMHSNPMSASSAEGKRGRKGKKKEKAAVARARSRASGIEEMKR